MAPCGVAKAGGGGRRARLGKRGGGLGLVPLKGGINMYVAILLPYRPLIAYIWGGGKLTTLIKKIFSSYKRKFRRDRVYSKVISEEGLPNI